MYKKNNFIKTIAMLILLILVLIGVNLFLFNRSSAERPFSLLQDQSNAVSGQNYLLKQRGGKTLKSKKATERIAVASMTKIMTALTIIENVENLEELVEVPHDIFPEIEAQGLATAGLIPGEVISYRELLYGIILPSGADAALAAVRAISGDEQSFVADMNERAVALGMKNTHFSNATGMDAPDHYSTVEDIMRLLEYALDNETFYHVFTSLSYQSSGTNMHVDGLTFISTVISRDESLELDSGRIIGGKTGYTVDAGLCLASLAEVEGEEYLLVLAGSEGDSLSEQHNIIESRLLYNQI
ncbi:D-alanyl-D-alanine carboxypeptidase [Enterococcus sp. BWM-S5]|uniref:D-alanyl-D-alanine carboxypeptidase n=1 Tax=Enterococcus larvae TaxID=2794352 RepID=A0ABS4CEI5_9ENTE|nr:D-alanyl-D-alanine carboxypeptidase [Enterococcus larvae]MBP1044652.1 D-alanyl-D-alanine carboxypeptidase [Enterococcus larvae]